MLSLCVLGFKEKIWEQRRKTGIGYRLHFIQLTSFYSEHFGYFRVKNYLHSSWRRLCLDGVRLLPVSKSFFSLFYKCWMFSQCKVSGTGRRPVQSSWMPLFRVLSFEFVFAISLENVYNFTSSNSVKKGV